MITFIFDFDGTLADSFQLNIQVYNQLATKYGYTTVSNDQVAEVRHHPVTELFTHTNIPKYKLPFLLKEGQQLFSQQLPQLPIIAGLPAVLTQLHHHSVTLGILTSNSQANAETFLTNHHILELFDFVEAELDLLGKAHKLTKLLKKYRLDSTQTVYIGDENRDIEAAHQARLPAGAVTWGFNSETALATVDPDFWIHQPPDLLEVANLLHSNHG